MTPAAAITLADMKAHILRTVAWLIEREGECLAELARIQDERRLARIAIHEINQELER